MVEDVTEILLLLSCRLLLVRVHGRADTMFEIDRNRVFRNNVISRINTTVYLVLYHALNKP